MQKPRKRRAAGAAWLGRTLEALARALGPRTYFALALALSGLVVVDATVQPLMRGLEKQTNDLMMRSRLAAAGPDPDIVVIDIDEASLAAMAKEYGRWPWPRAVLAEMLEAIEAQQPRAVAFDILFSDEDVQNPSSDVLFDEAVGRSKRSYFSLLRLDSRADGKSRLRASMVPGALKSGEGDADPAISMILPRFPAMITSARLGTTNADPDSDSVVRRYQAYEEAGAWRIASLPLKIIRDLGYAEPESREIVLNWRGRPFAYRFVSFADVHADLLRRDRKRPKDEFAGKIVLIGSTAPSLFDVKATPMAKVHPGVEILATAIDNMKHGDYYRPIGKWLSALVSVALIWGLALALRFSSHALNGGPALLAVQVLLLAIAYASINLSTHYIDFTASVAFGLLFFALANLRLQVRERTAYRSAPAMLNLESGRRYRLQLLLVAPRRAALRPRTRARLLDMVCASKLGARLTDQPFPDRGVLGRAFRGLVIVYWLCADDEIGTFEAVKAESGRVQSAASELEAGAARVLEHVAAFEWDEARPGRIGEILLDALELLKEGR